MRLPKTQLTLNEQERTFIKLGLEFATDHQAKALASLESKDERKDRGYSPIMDRMLTRTRHELVTSRSGKFRFDAIETAVAQFALGTTVRHELWRKLKASSGEPRKREPERILSDLRTKLENYHRCRQRQAEKPSKQKAYSKRQKQWQASAEWLRSVLEPKNENQKKRRKT